MKSLIFIFLASLFLSSCSAATNPVTFTSASTPTPALTPTFVLTPTATSPTSDSELLKELESVSDTQFEADFAALEAEFK